MCMICERIRAIKNGTNPYFVQELETGYVVLGDHQHFKGYTLFLCKQHAAELFCLERAVKIKFLEEMSLAAQAVSAAFGAEKMNCELLGNGDAHLHWASVPARGGRFRGLRQQWERPGVVVSCTEDVQRRRPPRRRRAGADEARLRAELLRLL